MEKITPINIGCCGLSKTIPLAFDESMSFMELLCAMNSKLTEAINDLNTIIEDYSEIEVNFDNIYDELENLNNLIIQANNYSESLVSNLRVELQGEFNYDLNIAVEGLTATIENNYTTLDNKINNAVVGQVDVYNPTNAQVENIDKVIMDIYNANRLYAITCTGFDSLELTCTEFESKDLTAYDFDNYSLELLSN